MQGAHTCVKSVHAQRNMYSCVCAAETKEDGSGKKAPLISGMPRHQSIHAQPFEHRGKHCEANEVTRSEAGTGFFFSTSSSQQYAMPLVQLPDV
mmetsp:Transcript_106598/g.206496  ORF Transcript_106598/g.206496 Transcript_106598/m.206496 type:complete len:94 (-) Transcript_106598:139-420(-)